MNPYIEQLCTDLMTVVSAISNVCPPLQAILQSTARKPRRKTYWKSPTRPIICDLTRRFSANKSCEALLKTPIQSPRSLTQTPSSEQRSSPRKLFTASLDVRIPIGTTCRGVARDLSTAGIGAIVFVGDLKVADLRFGDSVVIGYKHPSGQGTELVARLARVTGRYGNRYGFRFDRPMDVA